VLLGGALVVLALSYAREAHAIIGGVASPAEQDFVVQLAYTKSGNRIAHCSGTVVAKRLVLTARHCVGEASLDDSTITDYKPSILQVLTGRDASKRVLTDAPAQAKGAKLFVPKTTYLIPDVAVILTDVDLDTPIAQLRLERGVVKNESVDLIGYGLTEDGTYPEARRQRTAVKVFGLGPQRSRFFEIAAGEYLFGEAACSGDSGGPAIATKTGAVVGVASRVGNGKDKSGAAPAAFCIGDVVEDVYGDLTLAKEILDEAFREIGEEPWLEGQEQPKSKSAGSSGGGTTPAQTESGCNTARTEGAGPHVYFALLTALAASLLRRARSSRRR
jgi:secreted trypsin-like serine protease